MTSSPAPPSPNGRLYAELHLHLGGAISPRILYVHLQRTKDPLLERFDDYEDFENYFRRPRRDLDGYLRMHKLVEPIQHIAAIPDFIFKLVRGAYLFEDLAYIELRYSPYKRTDSRKPQADRLHDMEVVVQTVHEAAEKACRQYPLIFRQILCMDSIAQHEINERVLDLALASRSLGVVAIDLAGPDWAYRDRLTDFISLFRRAKNEGLKTTCHLYETPADCHPELLPHLDRIGHGIQIPLLYPHLLPELARLNQCLEVCPTSYLKTGTLKRYDELKPVFDRCKDAGVPITLCTDNAGLHMTRLPAEFENLLIHEVIDFQTMLQCQDDAFKHAFAWPFPQPARHFAQAPKPGVVPPLRH